MTKHQRQLLTAMLHPDWFWDKLPYQDQQGTLKPGSTKSIRDIQEYIALVLNSTNTLYSQEEFTYDPKTLKWIRSKPVVD